MYMKKKSIFLILTMLMGIVRLPYVGGPWMANTATAQQIGEWKVYPSYWIATKNIAVGNAVYGLMNGNLLRYDSEDTSVKTYNSIDDLNDIHIAHIAYSSDAKRLILVYDNGNIDLMDLEDNVTNIASLKNSTMSGKDVNNLSIDGKTAYLCTNFGYITVDMEEGVILDTYNLGEKVTALSVLDGVTYISTSNTLYCSTTENKHLLQNWKKVFGAGGFNYMVTFDGAVYVRNRSGIYRISPEGAFTTLRSLSNTNFLTVTDNKLMFGTTSVVYAYSDVSTFLQVDMPNQWQYVSFGGGIYWASENTDGLKGYKLSSDTFVETVGKIQPNSPIRDYSYRLSYVGDRLLVSGGINTPYAIYNPATAMYYEDGEWTNFDEVTPAEQYPNLHHWNTTHLVQDPNDPSHHFASPYRTGLYEYRDAKFVKLHNSDNSPLCQIYNLGLNFVGCAGLQYDTDGNLWIMNQQTDTIVRILQPSGKWLSLYYSEIAGTETPEDFLFSSSGVNFLVSRRVEGRGFFGFYTNGTLNTVRDDKHMLRSTLINQDGTSYSPDEFYCMTEDYDGRIWCGTQLGLFVVNDATTFFDNDFTFEQIKIARNDGSGLADYLLSGVSIMCIAVDGANRKWIGTASNGLYLVSADGQELLQHFTAEDSPLLSNSIRSLAIHPTTGTLMIGTDVGLCSYVSDATEAEEQLKSDNVVAYPNPVSPDHTGPIAVRGLTQDGEVKICTATGQLVWSGVSNGGTFTWNGTNKRGKRVSSGVYHVIANTSDGHHAVVCRIIVIK